MKKATETGGRHIILIMLYLKCAQLHLPTFYILDYSTKRK